jgi:hypothetical protein
VSIATLTQWVPCLVDRSVIFFFQHRCRNRFTRD